MAETQAKRRIGLKDLVILLLVALVMILLVIDKSRELRDLRRQQIAPHPARAGLIAAQKGLHIQRSSLITSDHTPATTARSG